MIRFGIQQPKYDHDRIYSSKNELSIIYVILLILTYP